ncbi:MAG TPA: hypothetical protein VHY36_12880, partial [Steroidobacteraceae bacterium]|nr:hypothetical protein [Steroidobacteraceae bacterium]
MTSSLQDSGVSAFAADRHISAMTERTAKVSLPSITARPTAAEKARFRALAMRAGMSESALALVAIRSLLDPDGTSPPTASIAMERWSATIRSAVTTIRFAGLRPHQRSGLLSPQKGGPGGYRRTGETTHVVD